MRILLLTFLLGIALLSTYETKSTHSTDGIVVLELFTSQGCSSCPAADKLLSEVNATYHQQAVFPLSYHVGYWNYIGWKDPFSSSIHTDRQRAYARKFKSRSIYTPQIVVNGREGFVGSNKNVLYDKIKKYLKLDTKNSVQLSSVVRTSDVVQFKVDIGGNLEKKKVRAILVLKERKTFVKRGENKNRKLTNANIVIAETSLPGKNKSLETSLAIPKELVKEGELLQVVVLIQDENLDITGAGKSSYLP